jgi:uncharacterized protein (TIGR03083 family)
MTDAAKVAKNIQLVRALSNELAAYFYSLPDGVWRRAEDYPSACEGWKVADVIAHLIDEATTYSMSIERALNSSASPPMGYRKKTRQEAADEAITLRKLYDEDLFYEFNASCKHLNTLLVSLPPEDYARLTWHPMSIVPIWRLVELRALELAVHGWDVRYCFDRAARLSPRAIPFLKDFLGQWLRMGFQKGEKLESPLRYRFRLNDPVAEGYDVVIWGNDFQLQPSDSAQADVTFRCDTDAYLLFGMGRLPLARSVRRGRLALEGDLKLAESFTEWFKPL